MKRNNLKQVTWILKKSLDFINEYQDKPWSEIVKASNKLLEDTKHNYFFKIVIMEVLRALEGEKE